MTTVIIQSQNMVKLRIDGEGGVRVNEVEQFLSDLNNAYVGLMTFERTILRAQEDANKETRSLRIGSVTWHRYLEIALREYTESIVFPSPALVLSSVQLGSPGFWEVLGALNPLETLRKYLQDRHE